MSKVSIAVIGISGELGKPVLAALKSSIFADKVSFPVKAITRKSDLVSTEHIQYVQAELSDTASVAEHLKGTDVIIELINSNPVLFAKTEEIVAAVKPKLFIPSQFGVDLAPIQKLVPGFLSVKSDHSQKVRSAGIKVIDVYPGYFAEKRSFGFEDCYGIDSTNNVINQIGDANTKVSRSTYSDIGNTVAALATAPDPSSLPDTVRVYSENVTFQYTWDAWNKFKGLDLKVASVRTPQKTLAEFQESWASGTFQFSQFFPSLYILAAQEGTGTCFAENERELVNPKESLWKWDTYPKLEEW